LQDAEPADLIGRVADQAHQGEEVFDVGRLEVADASVLDVGDAPPAELELEQVGVVGGAHQHCLLAQREPAFVRGQHALGDRTGLLDLVAAEDQLRPPSVAAGALQSLRVAAFGLRRDGVGGVEDRLG
jgi:hypothetical protein